MKSYQRSIRIASVFARVAVLVGAWFTWQVFLIFIALLVYANVFSEEFGKHGNRFVDPLAGIALLATAVWFGTLWPMRRWRARHSVNRDDCVVANGGA